ncbi:MAG: NrsF family protein [Caldimonas sp.]
MKTDDLVKMLATGAGSVDPRAVGHRYMIAIGAGALGAALLMTTLLGVRHDIGEAARLPMFWGKLVYVLCLAAAGVLALSRIARPGSSFAWVAPALVMPLLLMWLLGLFELSTAGAASRRTLLFGSTWRSCPLLIALLSAPSFVAFLWVIKGLAPTRLRVAGATAGFASGAIAASVYALHCPEMGAPFLGLWYVLGMLIPAAAGAALGPRLLRW